MGRSRHSALCQAETHNATPNSNLPSTPIIPYLTHIMTDANSKRTAMIAKVGCLAVGAAPVLYIYFVHDIRLKYFVLGSGSWGFGVLLKMLFHATVMKRFTKDQLTTQRVAILSGFVSGLTELGLAFVFLAFLSELTFWQVMAFGTGIGAVEAWVVATTPNLLKGTVLEEGVQSLESAIAALPTTQRMLWEGIAPIGERILALAGHITTRGLVYVTCRTLNFIPALLALSIFVVLDGIIGFWVLVQPGSDRIRRLAQFYFWFTLIAAVSVAVFAVYWKALA